MPNFIKDNIYKYQTGGMLSDAQKELLDRIRSGSANSDADESINEEFDLS